MCCGVACELPADANRSRFPCTSNGLTGCTGMLGEWAVDRIPAVIESF